MLNDQKRQPSIYSILYNKIPDNHILKIKWRDEKFSRARSCQRVRSKKHDHPGKIYSDSSKFKEDSQYTILFNFSLNKYKKQKSVHFEGIDQLPDQTIPRKAHFSYVIFIINNNSITYTLSGKDLWRGIDV